MEVISDHNVSFDHFLGCGLRLSCVDETLIHDLHSSSVGDQKYIKSSSGHRLGGCLHDVRFRSRGV
jgi:hypothetical protein